MTLSTAYNIILTETNKLKIASDGRRQMGSRVVDRVEVISDAGWFAVCSRDIYGPYAQASVL
jgi:hypothetical protein